MYNFKADFIDNSNKILIDEINDTTAYIGQAVSGTATNAPFWSIRKVVTSASWLAVTFANGAASFDQVWDDRLTYTYS